MLFTKTFISYRFLSKFKYSFLSNKFIIVFNSGLYVYCPILNFKILYTSNEL